MNVLITGAAGNLGSLLATHLLCDNNIKLCLMIHRRNVAKQLKVNSEIIRDSLDTF